MKEIQIIFDESEKVYSAEEKNEIITNLRNLLVSKKDSLLKHNAIILVAPTEYPPYRISIKTTPENLELENDVQDLVQGK